MLPRTIIGLALTILPFAAAPARAQTSRSDPSDLQAWYSAAVNVDLPDKWEAAFKYRFRLEENSSAYKGSYFYAELGRTVWRSLSLFGEYRLALVDDGQYHRYALGAQASYDLGDRFELSFRPMIQHQRRLLDDDEDDHRTLLRTRAKAEYRLTEALELHIAVEPYFESGVDYPIREWRNKIGFQYEYAKNKRVDLFYIYRPDYAKSYNRTFHVIGVELDFEVKLP